jgi:hypothetical protein
MASMTAATAATRRGCSSGTRRLTACPAWFCQTCGFRIRPLVGTIFARSSTSLHLWFYAIFLMTSTRCGISAKQLERELGVTYKTAWRMFNKIRNDLMDRGAYTKERETVIGMVERKGRVVALHISEQVPVHAHLHGARARRPGVQPV